MNELPSSLLEDEELAQEALIPTTVWERIRRHVRSGQAQLTKSTAAIKSHVKAIVLRVSEESIVVLLPKERSFDPRKAAEQLNTSSRKIKLYGEDEVEDVCGFPVGRVPIVGHTPPLRIMLDSHVLDQEQVTVGIGCHSLYMTIASRLLLELTAAATVADLSKLLHELPMENDPASKSPLAQQLPTATLGTATVYTIYCAQDWHDFFHAHCPALMAEHFMGVDAEWTPHCGGSEIRPKEVAVLQLGTDSVCAVIHLVAMAAEPDYNGSFPDSLVSLLSSERPLKCGVGIYQDMIRLKRAWGLTLQGCVDITGMAHKAGLGDSNKETVTSMQALAALVLEQHLPKTKAVRCGNWQAHPLHFKQVKYAALDAVVGYRIVQAIVMRYCENGQSVEAWLSDVGAKPCTGTGSKPAQEKLAKKPLKLLDAADDRMRQKMVQSASKGTIYENCELQDPSGLLIGRISGKKMSWYLNLGLADQVSDNAIRLKFQPKSGPKGEGQGYELELKRNICVGCGSEEHLSRFHVVPHTYRKHFPLHLKSHSQHDVTILCVRCHYIANQATSSLMSTIANEYNVPRAGPAGSRRLADRTIVAVTRAASALIKSGPMIPADRRAQLLQVLEEHFGRDVGAEDIEAASNLDPLVDNDEYASHGERVVSVVMERGELFSFIRRRWRRHFLDSLQPQYLSDKWSVGYDLHQ